MSSEQDPPRLFLSEAGSARELRLALGAAKSDLPDSARLEAILAGLPLDPGPPDGGGDGGGGDAGTADPGTGTDPGPGAGDIGTGGPSDITSIAPAAAAASAWTKLAGVLSLGAALAGVTYVATQPPEAPPTAPSSSAPVVSAPAPSIAIASASSPPEPTPSASAAPSATHTAVTPPPPSASAPPRPEIEILKEAREALGSNPSRTLALVNEHARSHPKGSLGQEREMLRIQALVGLGRSDEARALAEAFKKRNPNSVYVQRLDGMFP